MRTIRYGVAASLDGYIADEQDGYDWIPMDPDIDFDAIYARYDTLLMGRRTWEVVEGEGHLRGMEVWVVSRTLKPEEHPDITVVREAELETRVRELQSRPGKDIWLYGGGELFRAMLALDLVDELEVAVLPVLLGGGIPLLPAPAVRRSLRLTKNRLYEKSGILLLEYAIERPSVE